MILKKINYRDLDKYNDTEDLINDYFKIYKMCNEKDIQNIDNYKNLDTKFPLCLSNSKNLGYFTTIVLRSGKLE